MRKSVVLVIFALIVSVLAHGQSAVPHLQPGSKIYLEPMGGFETYLSAAILKKKVPLTVIDNKDNADYIVTGTSSLDKASWAKTIFVSPASAAHASISIKTKAGEMVYAYSVDKANSARGDQSTAEACAKHIKGDMEKEAK